VVGDDERGRVASLAGAVVRAARKGGRGTKVTLSALAERLLEAAPRIPVRDREALRRQFPGLGPEEIADKLVSGAVRGSAAVGAGVGAAAMLPNPPAMPAELAAETLAVAMVEYKLIAELHELYGLRAPGNARRRGTLYLTEWSERRGMDVSNPSTVNAALGIGMKWELRQRLVRRTLRNLPTLTPFMVGAAVGAVLNRHDTRKLADRVRTDLRARQTPWPELPELRAPQETPRAPRSLEKPEPPAIEP
jgi:hypothetical protein